MSVTKGKRIVLGLNDIILFKDGSYKLITHNGKVELKKKAVDTFIQEGKVKCIWEKVIDGSDEPLRYFQVVNKFDYVM